VNVVETGFRGLVILEPKMHRDARGFFMETYNRKTLLEIGFDLTFVQDNLSQSPRGTLRGLHFQNPPFAQTKLVTVLKGVILDVVVDLRSKEPTFRNHFVVSLDDQKRNQLLVPKGFAHGFVVLSEVAEVFYKCDEHYSPTAEAGLLYNDPALGINWQHPEETLILSERDRKHPRLDQLKLHF